MSTTKEHVLTNLPNITSNRAAIVPKPVTTTELKQKRFEEGRYIARDGRAHFRQYVLDVVNGCNLRCTHCVRFSPYRKGIVPAAFIIEQVETWNKTICADQVLLMGGEPLLHPDFATIIREIKRITGTKIHFVTNGLLFRQVSQNVLDVIKEYQVLVMITNHSWDERSQNEWKQNCTCLKEQGINPYILNTTVYGKWREFYRMKDGVPHPFKDNPKIAYIRCCEKRCPHIYNNKLYKCSALATIHAAVEEGVLSAEIWKDALTYKPLPPDTPPKTIYNHFMEEEIPECTICPEKVTLVPHRQLEN
jgi:uncharacterized Fe-S cluster-containing radical SAM superfamily protein